MLLKHLKLSFLIIILLWNNEFCNFAQLCSILLNFLQELSRTINCFNGFDNIIIYLDKQECLSVIQSSYHILLTKKDTDKFVGVFSFARIMERIVKNGKYIMSEMQQKSWHLGRKGNSYA